MIEWDLFISHASEDKKDVVIPLAEKLNAMGVSVWLDKFEITVGDSLREKIDEGLLHSQFGVVVLSPAFFSKTWPKSELDGLISKESDDGKTILPVWHNVGPSDVKKYSLILAGRLGVSTSEGLDVVCSELIKAIKTVGRQRITGRPIYRGKLTKKALMEFPFGSILISNTVNPDLTPLFVETVGDHNSREALWSRVKENSSDGNTCAVFSDEQNYLRHMEDRHLYSEERALGKDK